MPMLHPSVAIDAGGLILVMWRNWLAGTRDMYLATSQDGVKLSTPEKLGNVAPHCRPMDGGLLAASAAKTVIVWRRDGEIFPAEPGQPERQVGKSKDVAIALSESRACALWSNGAKLESWNDGTVDLRSGASPSLWQPASRRRAGDMGGERPIEIRQLP